MSTRHQYSLLDIRYDLLNMNEVVCIVESARRLVFEYVPAVFGKPKGFAYSRRFA